MYEDNNVTYRVGINWKDILIKIVMLVLFIILLLWLFPRPNLDVFYDSVYSNNINAMRDAARNYYTIDRLPQNVGEQTSMTLKEMFDNHMLIRFTDKDGNVCDDTASRVTVSKISDKEYALKVQLNCGDQNDYILETIGCTSVCSNGTCQTVIVDNNNNNSNNGQIADNSNNTNNNNNNYVEDDDDYEVTDPKFGTQVTYYQHKKAVTTTKTVYTCPSGYTKNGTKCTKETTGAKIDATPVYLPDQTVTTDAKYTTTGNKEYTDAIKTKVRTDYSCPTGYTLNGSYCIKYTDATEQTTPGTYTCPNGYTLSGTKCNKVYDATYVAGGTTYSCPNGGTLSGTKCTITQNASASTTYTCPSGYTKNGTSCYKVYDATPNTTSTCPSGYTKSGSSCVKTYTATSKTTYSCPNGGTLSGTKCNTSSSYNATASTSYGSWVSSGTQYYTSANKAYTGTTSKLVYAGAVSGAVCGSPCGNSGIWYKYTYYTRSASTKYSCPNGGTLSGTKCTLTANPSTNTTYSCPNGGTLSGNKCTLTANATATTTYTCPSGYTKNGDKCIKTYDATPKTGTGYYTCSQGGTLSGTKCTLTTDATYTPGKTAYTCPAGYVLNGTKCVHTISATATDVYEYTCPAGYTKEGSGESTKCYKISTETKYYCEDPEATLNGTKCTKVVKGQISHYTCPAGYTLSGTQCTKKSIETIDATAKTEKKTSYKYTWSKKSYLEGWTFTGKTKVVNENYTAGQK